MPFPRADESARRFFLAILPDDPRVQVRPMFGHAASFVNGNMFAGFFGGDIFVRLPDGDRAELLQQEGASLFEPMAGHPMKEYVMLPTYWRQDPDKARGWVRRSFEWAARLPPRKQTGRRNT